MNDGTTLAKIILSNMIRDDQTYLSELNKNLSTIEFALSDTFSAKSSRKSDLQYTLWRLSREMTLPVLSQQMQELEQTELEKIHKTRRYGPLIGEFLLSEFTDMGAWEKAKLVLHSWFGGIFEDPLDHLLKYREAVEKHPPQDKFDAIEMFIRFTTPDDTREDLLPILSQYHETIEDIDQTLDQEAPFLAMETIDFYRYLETTVPIITWPEKRLETHPEAVENRLLPAIKTMRQKTGEAKNSLDDLQPKLH